MKRKLTKKRKEHKQKKNQKMAESSKLVHTLKQGISFVKSYHESKKLLINYPQLMVTSHQLQNFQRLLLNILNAVVKRKEVI